MATKEDLAGDRRREFVARIATGDWDAIVMTHSTFELLPCPPASPSDFIKDIIHDLEMAVRMSGDDRSNRIVKQLERMKKTWKVRLERLANQKKDDFLCWEALGIDWVRTTRPTSAKNLWRHTKMARIAGLPLSQLTARVRPVPEDAPHDEPLPGPASGRGPVHRDPGGQQHGRDPHLPALPAAQHAGGTRAGAVRRLGRHLRRDRHGARDRTRRQRLPPEHAVRALHQRAGPDDGVLRRVGHPHARDAES
jgi:hypothetical protein